MENGPTSEQMLDVLLECVVSRQGAPWRVVTDAGSNVAAPGGAAAKAVGASEEAAGRVTRRPATS